jgi:hypothetical protein
MVAWMERIGLMPSATGAPGGRRTGQRMTHYIIRGGLFDRAFRGRKFRDLYFDRIGERDDIRQNVNPSTSAQIVMPKPTPRDRTCSSFTATATSA